MKCEPFSPPQADAGAGPLALSLWLWPCLSVIGRDVCRGGGALLGGPRARISSTGGNRLSIWLSVALGDEEPWMNALLSPGQPGSQNLLMDTGLHRPWGSLPASIAPKDCLKPALFRNKATVFYDRSPWSLLSMAVEKALGEKQQKHPLND